MVTQLVSDAERARIEAAIAEVERKSAIEVVVAVVQRSDDYAAPRALMAFGVALSFGLAVLRWGSFAFPPELALLAELPAALLAYALTGQPLLLRWLLPAAVCERALRAHGFQLFTERGLHNTRDHTGLLILVTALERRVLILGDAGLHAIVGDAGWQEYVAHVISRVREGHAADGILEVLERIGQLAAARLPARAGDTNELPDTLLER